MPLTAVVNRERDEHGQTHDWVLVSTSNDFTAAHIRSTYELRSAIEERHRQYKCFWDLTRMHSCAFSLVVNQALFVLLAYTLVQAHLVLRQRQELTRGVWERAWQLLSPTLEVVAVYYRQRFCLLTLAEFGRILLEIDEPARGKLREKLRRIEREQYSLSVAYMNRFRDESGSVYWGSSESGIETLRILEGIGTTGVLFA